jgi:hypothetical protein
VLELQVAELVTSVVVSSVKVAVAANCFVRPLATLGVAGVTETETTLADVTVKLVEPFTPLRVAVMFTDPVAGVDARPLEPLALLITTVLVSDEPQVTDEVMV